MELQENLNREDVMAYVAEQLAMQGYEADFHSVPLGPGSYLTTNASDLVVGIAIGIAVASRVKGFTPQHLTLSHSLDELKIEKEVKFK